MSPGPKAAREWTANLNQLTGKVGDNGGQDHLGHVAFAPDSSELSADVQKYLGLIAKALTDRPLLILDMDQPH